MPDGPPPPHTQRAFLLSCDLIERGRRVYPPWRRRHTHSRPRQPRRLGHWHQLGALPDHISMHMSMRMPKHMSTRTPTHKPTLSYRAGFPSLQFPQSFVCWQVVPAVPYASDTGNILVLVSAVAVPVQSLCLYYSRCACAVHVLCSRCACAVTVPVLSSYRLISCKIASLGCTVAGMHSPV